MAMQFMPNSPIPPSGTMCSFPVAIEELMLAQGEARVRRSVEAALAQSRLERGWSRGQMRGSTSNLRRVTPADKLNLAMTDEKKSWLRRRTEDAVRGGLTRAYGTVKVDPERFLFQLRAAFGLPIVTFQGVYSVEMSRLDDVAESVIRSGMKMAAAEGAGFGLGGILTIVPDLGILSAITMRTIQKLSLIYGFEINTDDEIAELWIAAASAAGVDISRELVEKEVVNRFVPKVIQRIAARASTEVVEKWAGRLIPIASSAIGCTLNYYFVRTWGKRALAHFRKKHQETRRRVAEEQARLPAISPTPLLS